MSLFLLYFDDGPLEELAGKRAHLALHLIPAVIRHGGKILAHRVVAISDGVSSETLRDASNLTSAALRQELTFFLAERWVKGFTPRLLFHVFSDEVDSAPINVAQHVQVTVLDLLVRVTRVEAGGRSGAVGHLGPSTDARAPAGGIAEGSVGSLSDVLQGLPHDAMLSLVGAPRAPVERGAKKKKR